MTKTNEINKQITDTIISALDAGVIPWRKPWQVSGENAAINITTGKAYRGVNIVVLGLECMKRGYEFNQWCTFAQAKKKGGKVRKGEKSTAIFFWNFKEYATGAKDENGDYIKKTRAFLKVYRVFNVAQIDGIEPKKSEVKPVEEFKAIDACEALAMDYIKREKIEYVEAGAHAYYAPAADRIGMPPRKAFETESGFYSTLFHECAHSTGHKSRLNRLATPAAFGSHAYSKEELIAEFTAAFLCGHTGILAPEIDNAAAYINNWRKALQNDSSIVMSAAGAAQKAFDKIVD